MDKQETASLVALEKNRVMYMNVINEITTKLDNRSSKELGTTLDKLKIKKDDLNKRAEKYFTIGGVIAGFGGGLDAIGITLTAVPAVGFSLIGLGALLFFGIGIPLLIKYQKTSNLRYDLLHKYDELEQEVKEVAHLEKELGRYKERLNCTKELMLNHPDLEKNQTENKAQAMLTSFINNTNKKAQQNNEDDNIVKEEVEGELGNKE